MIIDTHSHYDDEAFDPDRAELLGKLQENGVGIIVNIGANLQTSRNTLELIKQYNWIYGAVGVHPEDVKELNEESLAWLREQTRQEHIVLVGEIGLDYYWNKDNKEEQIYWFRRQLQLAAEAGLPVCVHSRDAAQDTLTVLQEECEKAGQQGRTLTGILHCFAYSREMAEQFLALGFCLGIGGVVTFKNAKKLKEVVAWMPQDRILLETDCPYLAPEPNRGKRNSSLYLPYVVEEIARLRGITPEEVEQLTEENARRLLRL